MLTQLVLKMIPSRLDKAFQVKVLEITVKEADLYMSRSKPDKQEVIGHWLNAPPYKGHSVMIFREAGRLYIETIFNDSTSRNELVAENTPQGTRYREKGSAHPAAGEYWIIDSNGNLQTYDIDGLISIAQKVE